ncbi:DUF2922 domain-containing protein [Clostridium sp. C2-6-12]|uniref:DUF2922 domain-containing protein n=1 Tax=Clostridium sp. C2-6-12 TaxID=2698832 RepID=UPI00136C0867|nr:DUF2922 domain-containing protein [Clostridium sp. C2-6-12]
MEHILSMSFTTEKGAKSNININGVKPDLTQAQINTLMNTIIQKNIFLTSTGALVGKAGANITQRSVTKVEMV